MFKYGAKAGIMGVATVVLAVLPMLAALAFLPQLGESVPMRFGAAGEVLRYGSKYELLVAPVLALAMCLGSVGNGFRRASKLGPDDPMARFTFERFMRNGFVTGILLDLVSFYILYAGITGHGIGF